MRKITVNGHATFWKDDDDDGIIIYCKLSNLRVYNKLDDKSAQLYVNAIIKLSEEQPISLIIDLTEAKGTLSVSGARMLSQCFSNMSIVKCEAFIVGSLSIELIVLAYKRIYNTQIPFAIFKDMDKAKEYCLKQNN